MTTDASGHVVKDIHRKRDKRKREMRHNEGQIVVKRARLRNQEIMPRRLKVQRNIIAVALAHDIKPIVKSKLPFGGVTSFIENKLEWDDFSPGRMTIYNLRKIKTPRAIVALGTEVFGSLKGKLTNIAVCKLILLAYNLRDTSGQWLFSHIPDELTDGTTNEFEKIPKRTLVAPASTGGIVLNDTKASRTEVAIGFSYLAASYMRLFTKSADNFFRIDKHLKEGFSNFFNFEFPFSNYHPDIEVIKAIKSQFDTDTKLKNTFYAFLYAGEKNKNGKDLKTYLYSMHVAYTGIHCYTLFLKCIDLMRVEVAVLAGCFESKSFDREIKSLSVVMNNLQDTSSVPGREMQMWRFARIFDKTFAAHLQTKNCVLFTSILAVMYHKMVPPIGTQDSRKIAKVKEYLEADNGFVEFYALRTMMLILRDTYPDNFKIWFELLHAKQNQIGDKHEFLRERALILSYL